jgi:uncharacterized protein YgbK (DUF1537 family)
VNAVAATLNRAQVFAGLPTVWPEELQPLIAEAVRESNRTLVVLDDDPTGTQTVYDVPVVTRWDQATLRTELARASPCFFILTNSRSLTTAAARALHLQLAVNLRAAAAAAGRLFTLVSRGDSTLRGHFPAETDALAEVLGAFDAVLLVPYFEAGGRYTVGSTHYVAEGDVLVPAAETPFAGDAVFGYRHSDLRAWVEEKTGGRIRATEVSTISIEQLRQGGPRQVAATLMALRKGAVCAVDACAPRDVEVLALATLETEAAGRAILFRTAASFVAARLGLPPRGLLEPSEFSLAGANGGLVVLGSHVPKTTTQLSRLLASGCYRPIELPVEALLGPARGRALICQAADSLNDVLAKGEDAVLFTSRALVKGADAAEALEIGRRVSTVLVEIVRRLKTRPRFLIAKGGITSSDLATRGLGVVRAMVRGQILPGVPVWQLGEETRFPGLNYVVFPGNVGDADALVTVLGKLRRS